MLFTILFTYIIKLAFLLGWLSPASSKKERTMRLERKEKKNETPQQNSTDILQIVLLISVIVLVIILVMLTISVPLTREIYPIIGFIGISIAICLAVILVRLL